MFLLPPFAYVTRLSRLFLMLDSREVLHPRVVSYSKFDLRYRILFIISISD